MNLLDLFEINAPGLAFVFLFASLIVIFVLLERKRKRRQLRHIEAFDRLERAVGLAVEAGKRLHLLLGNGGVTGIQGTSALIGMSLLDRIARASAVSDRPPSAASGEGTLALLSMDILLRAHKLTGTRDGFDPYLGRLSGLTPFAFAAGDLPAILDEHISATVIAGHFGNEVALLADAADRVGSLITGGSDSLPAQAILYTMADDLLIGEDLYAAGAFVNAGTFHNASLSAQDVLRWLVVVIILVGAAIKFLGVL